MSIYRQFVFTAVIWLLTCSFVFSALEEERLGPSAPGRLLVEDRFEPVGIDDTTPEFSWLPQDARSDSVQSAYHILVASSFELLEPGKADKWDSGKIASSNTAYITYAGKPLGSRQMCWWQVRTADGQGQWGPWSQAARFELGLPANKDWDGAQWIWGPQSDAKQQHYYFRKPFTLPDKPIKRARLYISSVHHHRLYLDGELFGWGQAHESSERQYYQTFDIGSWLKPGRPQVLGIRSHWFGGGQGRPAGRAGLLVKMVVDFTEGESLTINSNQTWKIIPAEWIVQDKPLYRNGEGIPSEYIDGRKYPQGWNLPTYDDTSSPNAIELGPQPTDPWTGPLLAQETTIDEYEITPAEVKRLGHNHFVADFGKVWSGRPKIHFTGGRPGTLLRIKADYRKRPDGTLEGRAQSTNMDYEYTLRGGEEVFEPFWYLGFQYLEIEVSQSAQTNTPTAEAFDDCAIHMVVRHNKVDPGQSSFECSDTMINAVWELVKRSTMLGGQECFVDTPTREQGQFTYDAYLISVAAMKCFGERDLAQKGLREIAHSQNKWHRDTGKVNAVYPYDNKRDIPDWTQSWVFWAYEYYQETGDLELIGELFKNLVRTGEYNKKSENRTTGLIDWGNDSGYASGIVDWPDRFAYDRTTTQRTVLSCNAYLDYLYISRLAEALGRQREARRFARYADGIRAAIQKHLWSNDKQAYVDGLFADGVACESTSQQANMMPLALGFTDDSREQGAMRAVQKAGFATSPVLTPFLIRAYGEMGEDQALRRFMTGPEGHNWAYIIADGGSCTYESWRGRNARHGSSESHPFGALGGVIAVQDYILGVQPQAPQYARVSIRPRLLGLTYARGTVPTQRGPIHVCWTQVPEGVGFTLKINLPCNIRGDVYLPREKGETVMMDGQAASGVIDGKYLIIKDVGSGEHVFVCE